MNRIFRLTGSLAFSLPLCVAACWTGIKLLDLGPSSAEAQTVTDVVPATDTMPTTDIAPATEQVQDDGANLTAPRDSASAATPGATLGATPGRGFGGGRGRGGFGLGLSPQARNSFMELRDREDQTWSDFMSFADQNSPYRFRLLTRQPLIPFSQQRQRLLQRYQTMQQTKQNQPELYQLQVRQFKEEDNIIGLTAQLRQAKNSPNAALRERLKAQIRNEAATLVDIDLQERQLRIQNLEKVLNQEKTRLQQDTDNRQQRTDSRADQIINQTGGANNAGN